MGSIVPSSLALVLLVCSVAHAVEVTIDTSADVRPISPFVYGSNGHGGDEAANVTVMRWGGNRTTGYNWETNHSSAGADWEHSSDDWLLRDMPEDQWRVPGVLVSDFHKRAVSLGAADLITLQMAGYVAADNQGAVQPEEAAPSPRWARVEFRKEAPFLPQPDTEDGTVYMDELVNLLVQRHGRAADGGVRMYSLDNEPAIWHHTHARIHRSPVTCDEFVERSVGLAAAVKDIDPTALIVGGALYGWTAFEGLTGEEGGWDAYADQYDGWFLNLYLDRMRQAEEEHGRRLLDVLDVHWYPEVRIDNVRITAREPVGHEGLMSGRIHAPLSLWNPDYREESWLGQWKHPVRLLGRLRDSIDRYYPGTLICIGEYNYGGDSDVSGAIAQADFLGVCGREGVYMTSHWGALREYVLAGFQVFRNYDGAKSAFGETSVRAQADDPTETSAYASLDAAGRLHVVLINKQMKEAVTFELTVRHDVPLVRAEVYVLDSSGPAVRRADDLAGFEGNRFSYEAGPLSVSHLVLQGAAPRL